MASRWLALLMVVLGVARAAVAEAGCARPFDDPNDVLTFRLKMKRADWDKLRADTVADSECNRQNPYYEAEFRCGDEPQPMVIGVRKKRGDQRGRDTDQKPPIKLDFNWKVMGQSWPAAMGRDGYRKLSLNNGNPDNPGGLLNVLLSEHMALRYLKREVPQTPSTAFAKVFVTFDDGKTEYHGLYVLIEDIDRNAVRRRWGNADGRLAKTTAGWGNCPDEIVYDDEGTEPAKAAWDAWYRKSPSGDWLAQTAMAVELEDFLRQEAARDLLGNRNDTPMGMYYNNFLTFDPKAAGAKRWFIPWDLDDCLGQGSRPPPTTPILPSCSPIGDKTRCPSGAIQKRYLELMCQLTNGPLKEAKLVAEWEAVDKIVRPIVAEEKDPVWGGRDPLGPMGTWTRGTYGTEYTRVRQWLMDRVPDVRRQITAKGVACTAGCPAGASEKCQHLACPGTRRCTNNEWTACVPDPGCMPGAPLPPVADGGTAPVIVDAAPAPVVDARGTDSAAAKDAGAPSGTAGSGGTPPAPMAGAPGSATPPAGGAGGAGGTGTPPRRGGAGGTAEPSDPPTPTRTGGKSGGCATAGAPAPTALLLLGAAALIRRRRRR